MYSLERLYPILQTLGKKLCHMCDRYGINITIQTFWWVCICNAVYRKRHVQDSMGFIPQETRGGFNKTSRLRNCSNAVNSVYDLKWAQLNRIKERGKQLTSGIIFWSARWQRAVCVVQFDLIGPRWNVKIYIYIYRLLMTSKYQQTVSNNHRSGRRYTSNKFDKVSIPCLFAKRLAKLVDLQEILWRQLPNSLAIRWIFRWVIMTRKSINQRLLITTQERKLRISSMAI